MKLAAVDGHLCRVCALNSSLQDCVACNMALNSWLHNYRYVFYLGEEHSKINLSNTSGLLMEARQPTIPDTEWPTYMHLSLSSSSKMARRSSAYAASELEDRSKSKCSGLTLPANNISNTMTLKSGSRYGRICFHTDWSPPKPCDRTNIQIHQIQETSRSELPRVFPNIISPFWSQSN